MKLVDKMCKYEMDLASIMEDTEWTLFHLQTGRQMGGHTDGQTDGVKAAYFLNFVGGCGHKQEKKYINYSCLCFWIMRVHNTHLI